MNFVKQKNTITLGLLFTEILSTSWFLLHIFDNKTYITDYCVLLLSYIYVFTLFILIYNKRTIDIFEPINIFFIIYLLMYSVTPMVLIIQNNVLCAGVNVMGGCVKATIIYMLSITVYCLFYFRKSHNFSYVELDEFNYIGTFDNKRIFRFALILWVICAFINIFYLLGTGRSITYIFTFGLSGEMNEDSYASNAKFLTDFGYGMIGSWFYISLSTDNKKINWTIGMLTTLIYLIRGFRFIIVIMYFGYFALHFILARKSVKIKHMVMALIGFFIMISIVGFLRNDLRNGENIGLSEFDLFSQISFSLYSNFNIYQLYYALVDKMPNAHSFGFFDSLIDSLSGWIPRILWSSKPASSSVTFAEAIIACVNRQCLYGFHMASPDMGAYYFQAGSLGCLCYSAFWGKVCEVLNRRLLYNNTDNIHKLVMYCLIVPTMFNMIIRGTDFVGFIKQFIFIMFPAILMPILLNTKIK